MLKLQNAVTVSSFGSLARVAGLITAAALLLAALPLHATPYSDAVNALSPISYYQFNGAISNGGTATDDVGARNGTYNKAGGTIGVGTGIPLSGFGLNQSVQLSGGANVSGSDVGLPASNAARTFTAWIDTTNDNSSYRDVFSYGTPGNGGMVFTLVPSLASNPDFTANAFGVSFYGGGYDVSGTTKINNDAWHMIAFTVAPTSSGNANIALYVDGVQEASIIKPIATLLNGTFLLGTDPFNYFYDGSLAQVALFDTALNQSQISGLFAAASVPEPATITMVGIGLLGMVLVAVTRRRRRAA